ncbi:hydantoinase B/oxoprolinase [Salinisphaera sp. PC39]|uniref:hydantoinase B/oxoprolinase family protein n=1 Tax=Salinisphaera sp. PC39 TaxID=1304156 RepID=UPI003340973A
MTQEVAREQDSFIDDRAEGASTPAQTAASSAGDVNERLQRFLKDTNPFYGPVPEIMDYHGLAGRTPVEDTALSAETDPARLSIVRDRMQAALDEAFDMLANISVAPGAKWGDMVTALYTPSGDLSLASTGGVVIFSNLVQYSTKFINKYWIDEPTVGVREGDAFMHNDARYGTPHNADQAMHMPLFHDGRIIAWIGNIIHEGECGAKEPGGIPGSAETIWDEGFKMSPTKVAENYHLKRDLVTFLQNSSREPKLQYGDMKSKLYVCRRVEERLKQTIEEFGVEAVVATLRGNLENTLTETRKRLREWPDGEIQHVHFADHTLRESAMMKINLRLIKQGDKLTFDYRGSSPEITNRSNNSLAITVKGMLSQLFLTYIWPDLPRNQAVLAAMDFVFDEGSVLKPNIGTPNAQSMMTLFHAWQAGAQCVSKYVFSVPEKYTRFMAPWYTMINTFQYGGVTQHGEMAGNICADINGMGGGARADRDGEHSPAPFFATMADIGEQELIEEELPFLQVISKKLMRDNQSFGKYRGGMGYQMAVAVRSSEAFGFMATAQGSKFPNAMGVFGGYASPAYPLCRISGVDVFESFKTDPGAFRYSIEELMNERPFEGARYETGPLALKFEPAARGELYMMSQGTGGSYGDALERDPALVMADLEEDLISHDVAWRIYRVVYDRETLVVDEKATAEARDAERRARIERGTPFDDFCAEWVTDAPPAHLPYYGCWDDPEVVYAGSPEIKGRVGELPPVVMPDPLQVRVDTLEAELARARKAS